MAYRMGTFVDALAMSLTAKSRVAENAISPQTKSVVPVHGLDGRKAVERNHNKAAIRRADEISLAARTETFTSAAERLKDASTRLKIEADKQAGFWAELAEIRSKGWQVSRAPTNSKAFVVHIGSHESNPQYTSKGTVVLRQDDDGSLTFDGAESSDKRKILAIHIIRGGNVTGQCLLRKQFETSTAIEAKLVQARESLFQEELFTEACKEARGMANMGVIVRNGVIEARISDECTIQIQHMRMPTPSVENVQQDNHLAEFLCAQLRLMLVAEHQQKNIQRTTYKPLPISSQPRPTPDYALLRPIISQLRHQIVVSPVLQSLRGIQASLKHAGLDMHFQHDLATEDQNSDAKLSDLRRTVTSNIKITLPSGKNFKIVAETLLAAPRFGTQWCPTRVTNDICGDTIFPQTGSSDDIQHSIDDVLARDISSLIMKQPSGANTWQVTSMFPIELVLSTNGKPLVAISVSCRSEKLGLCILISATKLKKLVEWDKDGAREQGDKPDASPTLVKYLTKLIEDIK